MVCFDFNTNLLLKHCCFSHLSSSPSFWSSLNSNQSSIQNHLQQSYGLWINWLLGFPFQLSCYNMEVCCHVWRLFDLFCSISIPLSNCTCNLCSDVSLSLRNSLSCFLLKVYQNILELWKKKKKVIKKLYIKTYKLMLNEHF